MPAPSVSKGDAFADRVQRYRRTSKPTQRQYASAPSFGQKIVKPVAGQGKGPVNAPVGQAAPAAPATPQSYTGVPQPNWPDNLIEAAYGAPPGSAELARQQGWGANATGPTTSPAYSQSESFTPYVPTAPPGGAAPPANSIPASYAQGAGSFNVNPGAQDGRSPEAIAQAVASMQTPERIAQDARTRANSPYSASGIPWTAVDTNVASQVANPPGADWGYFNGQSWVPLTTYGSGIGAVAGAPAGGYAQRTPTEIMYGAPAGSEALARAQGWKG